MLSPYSIHVSLLVQGQLSRVCHCAATRSNHLPSRAHLRLMRLLSPDFCGNSTRTCPSEFCSSFCGSWKLLPRSDTMLDNGPAAWNPALMRGTTTCGFNVPTSRTISSFPFTCTQHSTRSRSCKAVQPCIPLLRL